VHLQPLRDLGNGQQFFVHEHHLLVARIRGGTPWCPGRRLQCTLITLLAPFGDK
jgi:hypothetical protein